MTVAAQDDQGRERLCRYGARLPFSLARLRVLKNANVSYLVKKVGRGRAKHRVMEPVELLARIAALVSPPRFPLVCFSGRSCVALQVAPPRGAASTQGHDRQCPCEFLSPERADGGSMKGRSSARVRAMLAPSAAAIPRQNSSPREVSAERAGKRRGPGGAPRRCARRRTGGRGLLRQRALRTNVSAGAPLRHERRRKLFELFQVFEMRDYVTHRLGQWCRSLGSA